MVGSVAVAVVWLSDDTVACVMVYDLCAGLGGACGTLMTSTAAVVSEGGGRGRVGDGVSAGLGEADAVVRG